MELQITNIRIESFIKVIVVAFIISAVIVGVRNFSATKATAITTTFAADSSWTKGGWK